MKTILLIVCLLLSPAIATATLGHPRMVAWWPLNGDGNDVTGTYNCTVVGSPTSEVGLMGLGYTFDATNSKYIKCGDILDSVLAGSTATFSIAVKFTTGATIQGSLFYKGADSTFGENQRGISIDFDANKLEFGWSVLAAFTYRYYYISPTLSTNTNYSTIITYDAAPATATDRLVAYLNGAQQTNVLSYTSGLVPTIADNTANLAIGASVNSAGNASAYNYKGNISDVQIYNKVMSKSDAMRIMYGFHPLNKY